MREERGEGGERERRGRGEGEGRERGEERESYIPSMDRKRLTSVPCILDDSCMAHVFNLLQC